MLLYLKNMLGVLRDVERLYNWEDVGFFSKILVYFGTSWCILECLGRFRDIKVEIETKTIHY